jgi:hypothetical protein
VLCERASSFAANNVISSAGNDFARHGEGARRRTAARDAPAVLHEEIAMIRKLSTGEYRLYSRKIDPKTGKRRNLGTFRTRAKAEAHERAVQYFKHH